MAQLPDRLYTAAQTRALDRTLIEGGIPGIELMTRAGRAALKVALTQWPDRERVVVVCGPGNNGGDGFVFARLAAELGLRPRVLLLGERQRIRGDARLALDAMEEAGVPLEPYRAEALEGAEYVVDGLFGTGLDRQVGGAWAEAIEAMNRQPAPILALDLPSGLHADTGAVLGVAVRAAHTATFIALKVGMFTHQGPDHCGRIHYQDLGASPAIFDSHPPVARLFRHPVMRLAPRRRESHKGTYGHVLVVGGEQGYAGAARMAAEAALRVGAGLVSVATRAAHATDLGAGRPELMVHGVETAADLHPLLARADVVLVGPGLGQGEWARSMLTGLQNWRGALVVDADALAAMPQVRELGDPTRRVFTPHPGEAARLLGTAVEDVQRDRLQAVRRLAALATGHWLLKGCGTLVSHPGSSTLWLSPEGNPGMATGGMGDVLAGVLAGLLAQLEGEGWEVAEAVRHGVALHAWAGDRAAAEGMRGMLPTDLYPHLRIGMDR